MSSISEESETGDDDHLDDEFIVCNDEKNNHTNEQKNQSSTSLTVNNCLGDLNSFKEVRSFFFCLLFIHIYVTFPGDQPSN
jgi:hypothetical protein